MKPVVFVGPTLDADAVAEVLDARILPPVAQGDLYRAARRNPPAIGIIDGYFQGVPSVWHKEILWALEQGIPVYGSSSMGALRAAEMDGFGMIGVGRVYEAFRDGVLEDDDEVAVLHGPAELGYAPLSEPMVSIRATLDAALAAGVIGVRTTAHLTEFAKALPYGERTWSVVLTADVPDAFRDWLPGGKIDAKGDDARAMLALMAAHQEKAPPACEPARLETTLAWRALVRRVDSAPADQPEGAQAILDELRLQPERYATLLDRAVLRRYAADAARGNGHLPTRDALLDTMAGHRTGLGLSRQAQLRGWLAQNDLDEAGYEMLLRDVTAAVDGKASAARPGDLLSELKWSGEYATLKARACSKADQLVDKGPLTPQDRLRALLWYFEVRLHDDMPDDLDAYAKSNGFADREEFCRLVEGEFLYCQGGGDSR